MKKILLLMLMCTALACKKDKKEVPAESEEVTYTKFVFDDENYEVEKIGLLYWTRVNFKTAQFGGKKPVYTFPSNVVTGRTYAPEEILEWTPPNGYRLPTRDDLFFMTIEGGRGKGWETVIDENKILGEVYEITDMKIINKFLDENKWELANGTNTTKFNAQPTEKSIYQTPEIYEKTRFLGQQNGMRVFLEIGIKDQNTGYLRVCAYDSYHPSDNTRYSVRFVKDIKRP